MAKWELDINVKFLTTFLNGKINGSHADRLNRRRNTSRIQWNGNVAEVEVVWRVVTEWDGGKGASGESEGEKWDEIVWEGLRVMKHKE